MIWLAIQILLVNGFTGKSSSIRTSAERKDSARKLEAPAHVDTSSVIPA